jgi:hypothetical protein
MAQQAWRARLGATAMSLVTRGSAGWLACMSVSTVISVDGGFFRLDLR